MRELLKGVKWYMNGSDKLHSKEVELESCQLIIKKSIGVWSVEAIKFSVSGNS